MSLASDLFLKRKNIVESKFLISVNYSLNVMTIIWAHMSCYEHITIGVIIICMGVSVYWPLRVLGVFMFVSLCVCVCLRSNQSTSKKPHYVSDLSKLIVCRPLPLVVLGGGVEPSTKFSKFERGGGRGRGVDRISIF